MAIIVLDQVHAVEIREDRQAAFLKFFPSQSLGFAMLTEMESFAGIVAAAVLSGVSALYGSHAKDTATLTIVSRTPNATSISIQERRGGSVIKNYDIDMLYRMHVIVVRSDFRQFLHIHPRFDSTTGRFSSALPIDASHTYYVYADTWSTDIGEQVFRFTIPGTKGADDAAVSTAASDLRQAAGPYVVRLETTTLQRGKAQQLPLEILLNGAPAANLHPYLEATAHVVLINVADLTYAHLHPVVNRGEMMMPETSVGATGPHLMLRVPPLPAGIYKLWLQFRGGKKLYVAAYTLAIR